MSCVTFHLTESDNPTSPRAIEQGASFDWLTFLYAADVSGYIPSGAIRRNWSDKDTGLPLAVLSFAPLSYGAVVVNGVSGNYTSIKPLLNALQTKALPIPRERGDDEAIPGRNCWVYEVNLTSPADPTSVIRIATGYVEVCPRGSA